MRPYGSPETLERHRRRAIALVEQGLSLSEVARRVQASVDSVYQWRQAWRTGGEGTLAPKPAPGAPCYRPFFLRRNVVCQEASMICVIIEVNLTFRNFTSVSKVDFRPAFDRLHARDKNGYLVVGGKLFKELSNRTASLRYLRTYGRCPRPVEPITFLMLLFSLKNIKLHAVDFVSQTVLT